MAAWATLRRMGLYFAHPSPDTNGRKGILWESPCPSEAQYIDGR